MNRALNNPVLIAGLAFIVLGIILLFERFEILHLRELVVTWWPLLLIAIGVKILASKNVRLNRNKMKFSRLAPHNFSESVQSDGTSKIYESRTFGDISRKITAKKFTGATFFCLAGDIEIDASTMQLAHGRWLLRVEGIFGDIHLRLPDDLPVLIRGRCAAGDIQLRDNKGHGLFVQRSLESPNFKNSPAQLVISASLLFGDICIE